MLREKIIATASKRMIVVADSSKQVPVLGKFPLPVEVISFAQALVRKRIEALGASVTLRPGADGGGAARTRPSPNPTPGGPGT